MAQPQPSVRCRIPLLFSCALGSRHAQSSRVSQDMGKGITWKRATHFINTIRKGLILCYKQSCMNPASNGIVKHVYGLPCNLHKTLFPFKAPKTARHPQSIHTDHPNPKVLCHIACKQHSSTLFAAPSCMSVSTQLRVIPVKVDRTGFQGKRKQKSPSYI